MTTVSVLANSLLHAAPTLSPVPFHWCVYTISATCAKPPGDDHAYRYTAMRQDARIVKSPFLQTRGLDSDCPAILWSQYSLQTNTHPKSEKADNGPGAVRLPERQRPQSQVAMGGVRQHGPTPLSPPPHHHHVADLPADSPRVAQQCSSFPRRGQCRPSFPFLARRGPDDFHPGQSAVSPLYSRAHGYQNTS